MEYSYVYSHVLTAGHCICDQVNSNKDVRCGSTSINQLRPLLNEITVYGGSYKESEMKSANYKYTWIMDFAYIMGDFESYDVGVAGVDPNNRKFFDTEKLFKDLKKSKIVPLCLGKESLDITNKAVKGAGWGVEYEEIPKIKPRKPIFSSCMTSQASPDMWRFQNCDLDRLSVSPGSKNLECYKKRSPPDYKKGQSQKCEKIFNDAQNILDGHWIIPYKIGQSPSKTIKDKLSKVDKIYLSSTLDPNERFDDLKDPEVCYNPDLLSNNGWCYLKDFPEKWEAQSAGKSWNREAWGICSPACDSNMNQVIQ